MLDGLIPFDLPMWTPKRMSGKQTRMMNNVQGMEIYSRLSNIMLSRFKWSNLPETCNERALEITLSYYGYALFFNDDNLGFIHTPCNLNGPFNVYYESINRHAYSFNYNKDYTIDNSVLIRGNKMMIPDYLVLFNYVPKITNALRAVDVHTETLKKPFILAADEREVKSVKRALNDVEDNEIAIVTTPTGNLKSLDILNTQTTCYLPDMWSNVKNYLQQAFTALGVMNTFSTKRERLVVSESVGEETTIRHTLESELDCRKEACEQINSMFGLNVQVEANELEQFNEEMLERELAKMGQQYGTQSTGQFTPEDGGDE